MKSLAAIMSIVIVLVGCSTSATSERTETELAEAVRGRMNDWTDTHVGYQINDVAFEAVDDGTTALAVTIGDPAQAVVEDMDLASDSEWLLMTGPISMLADGLEGSWPEVYARVDRLIIYTQRPVESVVDISAEDMDGYLNDGRSARDIFDDPDTVITFRE